MARLLVVFGLVIGAFPALQIEARQARAASPPQVIVLETAKGEVEIELWPSEAPQSVAHIVALTEKRFYKGVRIHWAQPGVIQFGDQQTRDMTKQDKWGLRGSGKPVNVAETSKKPFVRGSVGLAYRPDQRPTDADSQIFILRIANPALNGKYAMLGRVTKGMNVVDKLALFDEIKSLGRREAAK